jgi:hypothetical protein
MNQLIQKFNQTLDLWIKELDRYDYLQLCLKPDPDSWSMGQVYTHLLDDTGFFIRQIELCLGSNENASGQMTEMGRQLFEADGFPDMQLIGPPDSEAPPQPLSKVKLQEEFLTLKALVNYIGEKVSDSNSMGKALHPGFQYFSAWEWFQFAEMHLRHHLRQKQRIDAFLKTI